MLVVMSERAATSQNGCDGRQQLPRLCPAVHRTPNDNMAVLSSMGFTLEPRFA